MDSARAYVQTTAATILAFHYHADAQTLGIIGVVAQSIRLLFCLFSGRVSEKVGRTRIIIPSGILMAIAALGLTQAHNLNQVALFFTLAIVSLGAFYPPFQALIGQVSKVGELTKNLGAFNLGWCLFSAVAALSTRWLIQGGTTIPFYVATVTSLLAAGLVSRWRRGVPFVKNKPELPAPEEHHPWCVLPIARVGMVASFFGWGIIAMLFPKLANTLNWTDAETTTAVGMLMAGQFVGILLTNWSPWWRGKVWPQVMAQSVMLVCAVILTLASNQYVLDITIFTIGTMVSVTYAAALYHSTSARKKLGKNTGIHESLLAFGNVSGCLVGGVAATQLAPRAPYILFAVVLMATLVSTAVLARNKETCAT